MRLSEWTLVDLLARKAEIEDDLAEESDPDEQMLLADEIDEINDLIKEKEKKANET